MHNTLRLPTLCLATLLVVSLLVPTAALGSKRTQLVVIMSKDSPLEHISLDDLRRIFRSDRFDGPNGTRFIPFNHAPTQDDRIAFDRIVLNLEPAQVGDYWIDRRVRGEPVRHELSPMSVYSDA